MIAHNVTLIFTDLDLKLSILTTREGRMGTFSQK